MATAGLRQYNSCLRWAVGAAEAHLIYIQRVVGSNPTPPIVMNNHRVVPPRTHCNTITPWARRCRLPGKEIFLLVTGFVRNRPASGGAGRVRCKRDAPVI